MQARRVELVVVGGGGPGAPRTPRAGRAARARVQRAAVVAVDRVANRLALALRRLDPQHVGELARAALPPAVLLALPLGRRALRARVVEDLELVERQLGVLRVELGRLALAAADDVVDVVDHRHGLLRVDDLLGAVLDHVDEVVLVRVLGALRRAALLDNKLVEAQLLRGALEDLLLDGVLGDEAEDVDLLGLTDAVGAVHGLEVGLRVPAWQYKGEVSSVLGMPQRSGRSGSREEVETTHQSES